MNLAKQLMGEFATSSAAAGHSAKRCKIEHLSLEPENVGKHFSIKIKGRKKVFVYCRKIGRKTSSGPVFTVPAV